MPTPKQMEKLAASIGRKTVVTPPLGPQDEMPDEYWHAVLNDAQLEIRSSERSSAGQRLSEIQQHVLRVCCRRCARIVEIQKADAIRLYGQQASWREVGQRLLNNTCENRSGRHEEDGCWPVFESIRS
jgi:hypothetical protein